MSRTTNWRKSVATGLAVILAAGFVVLAPLTVLARSTAAVVFSPDVMASVLIQQFSLAEDVRRPLFEALMGSPPEQDQALDLSQALGYLTPEEQDQVLNSLIPPRWAQEQVEGAVRQMYAWLDNQDPHPTIALDMRPIKIHLLDSAVQAAVARVIDSWPDCTPEKLAAFAGGLLTGTPEMLYCSLPGALGDLLAGFLTTGLTQSVQALPPEIVLTPGSARPAEMLKLKQDLLAFRALMRWSWLVPAAFLLLILGLVVRSVPSWGRWWGWPLLGAGILSLASPLAGGWIWRGWLQRASAEAGVQMALELVDGVLDGLAAEIAARQLAAGVFLALTGIAMLAMAWFVRRRRQRALRSVQDDAPEPSRDAEPRPSGMFG